MIIVQSHKEIERYEVSCNSEESLRSLRQNLESNYGFELKNEWLSQQDGEVFFCAIFEREMKDLLLDEE